MKKNPRRGGPVSKMVMAALVLATTAGFVSGLTRSVSSAEGDSSVWGYVARFFAGPYASEGSIADSDRRAPRSTTVVTRLYVPVSTDKFGSHPVLEPREIRLLEPVENTTGVNSNGTSTFDANLLTATLSVMTMSESKTTDTPLSVDAPTGTAKDFFQNAALTGSTNYNPSGLPTNINDVRLTTTATALTITASTITMESLSVDNGRTYTISNATGGAGNSTLNLGNSSGFTNVFSGGANDLIYLTNNSTLTIQGPNSGAGTGTLTLALANSGNFNVGTGSTLLISAVITGNGQTITKTGGGTAIFTGANTYGTAGVTSTTVSAGTLLVSNTTGSGTGPGNVLVDGSGTLGGTGIITGAVTIASGGTLNPGPSGTAGTAGAVGTLTTGALTLDSGSFSIFDVSSTTNYDRLISSGALTFGGTLDVNIASGLNFMSGDTLNLFSGGPVSGMFDMISDGQIVVFDGYSFTADYTQSGFVLVAVPEPSTWIGAALALGAVGFTQRRRLRRLIARRA